MENKKKGLADVLIAIGMKPNRKREGFKGEDISDEDHEEMEEESGMHDMGMKEGEIYGEPVSSEERKDKIIYPNFDIEASLLPGLEGKKIDDEMELHIVARVKSFNADDKKNRYTLEIRKAGIEGKKNYGKRKEGNYGGMKNKKEYGSMGKDEKISPAIFESINRKKKGGMMV